MAPLATLLLRPGDALVRVAALGRNGTITALLKTLGTMTPDERRVQGPLINGFKDKVTDALTARRLAAPH